MVDDFKPALICISILLHYCCLRLLFSCTELCLKNLKSLSSIDLIDMDEDINIKPTGSVYVKLFGKT